MHTLAQLRSGELAGLTRLDLSENLADFPREIFDLADSLEILNLSGNQLTSLPDDLSRLHQLKIIFCSDNCFTKLPAVLGQCPTLEMIGFRANQITYVPAAALPPLLRWLTLTDNQIVELPNELGNCQALQKLMLAGNHLTALPATLAQCHKLELVRIAANRFEVLPDVLLQLPALAWLAFAGNPFCHALEQTPHAIAEIAWSDLALGQQLGEGASGVIYQAALASKNGSQDVAVKLFKAAVTSDGLPQCEMAACIAAGEHANLIAVHGRVIGHPEQRDALVLDLIDEHYTILAQPPSLASCTRDVYASNLRFTAAQAEQIYGGIAAAVNKIHESGLIHGDIYGHNILRNADGHALLGDFGAASLIDLSNTQQAQALFKIELRALAHLRAELQARSQ